MVPKTKTVHIRISQQDYEWLKEQADKEMRTISNLILHRSLKREILQ